MIKLFTLPAAILSRMQYCRKCHILSHKANNSPFCLYCGAILKGNPKLSQNSERVLIREKNRVPSLESLNTLPSYSKCLTPTCHNQYFEFLSGRMLLDPSLRPLGRTRIWTQHSKYRIKLKGTIAKTLFIPPCPLPSS